ncbi:UNVERIFIED_CONTAM: Berberine bridge enzyme-like 18 [Sesamum angustifolium]|uniref:Berberine bridge enzyme-like 18 n=1 Tax=Sesamum angustifolium TaxID=2727405 RepID=A0AAW2PB17_9LAMI
MKTPTISTLIFFLFVVFSCSWAASVDVQDAFFQCLSREFGNDTSISSLVYTPNNSSYSSILQFSIRNPRFISHSTPKPLVIITPDHESQIPPTIHCAKENGMQVRTRSGGHDYEGLSYASKVPFLILDLINLSEVTVDVEQKTAWVEAGATLGTLYYRIAEKSPILGFPAGECPTVGIGGYIGGGGYGVMLRKYGLAADNVLDARIVDVNGRILNRESMEKVTVFTVDRTLEQNATQLVHRWQYIAHKLDPNLFIRVRITRQNSSQDGRKMTIRASFLSLFLGRVDKLLPLMQESFPELGLVREDCKEIRWIQSVLYFADYPLESPEILLNRTQPNLRYFKGKSDYVQKPIPQRGFKGMWRRLYKPEAKETEIFFSPYGGRMAEISESAVPFPHRAGNLYKILYMAYWKEEDVQNSDRIIRWVRRLYRYMAPYVSKFPREAYVNYRDLDVGVNNNEEEISYEQASIWGRKYFKNNFDRLVQVKTMVDPNNFFKNEQSIPPLRQ